MLERDRGGQGTKATARLFLKRGKGDDIECGLLVVVPLDHRRDDLGNSIGGADHFDLGFFDLVGFTNSSGVGVGTWERFECADSLGFETATSVVADVPSAMLGHDIQKDVFLFLLTEDDDFAIWDACSGAKGSEILKTEETGEGVIDSAGCRVPVRMSSDMGDSALRQCESKCGVIVSIGDRLGSPPKNGMVGYDKFGTRGNGLIDKRGRWIKCRYDFGDFG